MQESSQPQVTKLIQLAAIGQSDAKDALYELVFDDLRVAAHRLVRTKDAGDLQATALVNEVVLRFEKNQALGTMANRKVFFSVALRAMNQVLIDHYRRRKKRVDSPDRTEEPLDAVVAGFENQTGYDFEHLQNALKALASESPRQHDVIMHRFFGGLSTAETAIMLDVSEETVRRDWRLARAKLFRRLKED